MVAQERHIPLDYRLLIVPVGDFINILRLSIRLFYPALEFDPERRKHLTDIFLGRHIRYSVLKTFEPESEVVDPYRP